VSQQCLSWMQQAMYSPYGSYPAGQGARDDPQGRSGNLEEVVRELAGRLESHIAESHQRFATLRHEVTQVKDGHSEIVRHLGRNGNAEITDLHERLARLEVELIGRRGRGAAPMYGSETSMESELMLGEKGQDAWSMLPKFADLWGDDGAVPEGSGSYASKWNLASKGFPRRRRRAATQEKESLPADAVVGLDTSIWDCALVIILHQGCSASQDPRKNWYLGSFNVIQTWALLAFNIVVQVLFICAVHSMSNPNPFRNIKDTILDMRIMVGQSFYEMDRKSMATRTEQTCNGQVYDTLAHTIRGIVDYLGLDVDKGYFSMPGNAICFLAMLFWVVEMTVELRRCADLLLVVLALPNTSKTVIDENSSQHVVKGVTRGHKVLCICCVLLPRAAISYYLLTFGQRFLAGTMDIGELILNTCALEFIQNVDDMLFEAMATRSLILFTQTAKIFRMDALSQQPLLEANHFEDFEIAGHVPARVPRMSAWRMEIINVTIAIAFVIFHSVSGYVNLIQPFVDAASGVYNEVCQHDIDFTYLSHPVTGVPVFAKASGSGEVLHMRCWWASQYEMVRIRAGFDPQQFEANATLAEMINGVHPACQAPFGDIPPMACPAMDFSEMSQLPLMTEKGYYASPSCRDQDVAFDVLRRTCLSEAFDQPIAGLGFFHDVRTCGDFFDGCRRTANNNVSFGWFQKIRKLCSHTCGLCASSEVVAT